MNLEAIAGVAHEPAGAPTGVVLLTHGAGGNRDAPLLQRVCEEWARRGWLAVRYDLPYRRRRAKGPPPNSAAGDQQGVAEAIRWAHELTTGPVIAGGHSYGGRMTSMVVAGQHPEVTARLAVLTLFSYPLHPPGKPERMRTEHLPDIAVPTVFTHGSADPFGSLEEVRAAAALIPAATAVVAVSGARHDLGARNVDVAAPAVTAALQLAP